MTYTSLFELFKVGIGPSSSHTMGPMLAAADFAGRCNRPPEAIRVTLFGSLALTGEGHGTDRAIVLGLNGHHPATVPVELAQAPAIRHPIAIAGGVLDFDPARDIERIARIHPAHANVMSFESPDQSVTYASIGGGFVVTLENGSLPRPAPPPVVPHPFDTASELLVRCRTTHSTIAELVAANEASLRPGFDLDSGVGEIVNEMYGSIDRGMTTSGVLPGALRVGRRARDLGLELMEPSAGRRLPPSTPTDWAGVYATAVNEENAAGGRVVTAPTNGAAGIIPAVLRFMDEFCDPVAATPHREFLLTAGAIGSLLKANAGISGAELGCQGEVGSACAMAAAGLTAALGGSPEQVENAAEIGIEHNLGLTCDPVGGLVQVPCIERNAIGSVKAIAAASLALRGTGAHIVPLDAAIETLRQTGADMDHKYKETSLGGLAVNVPSC